MPDGVATAGSMRRLGLAVLFTLYCAWLWHPALTPRVLEDEIIYGAAAAALAAGDSPYEVYGFVYPPAFAWLGESATAVLGERGAIVAFRVARVALSIALLAVAALLARPHEAVTAALLPAIAVPVWVSIEQGNASSAIAGMIALGLWNARERPWLAGALIGASVGLKPMGVATVPLLLAHTPTRRAGMVAAGATAVALAVHVELLDAFLAHVALRTPDWAAKPYNLSPHAWLWTAGIEIPPLAWLTALVVPAALVARCVRDRATFVVFALATATLSVTVLWVHTASLAIPAVAFAASRTVESLRGVARRRRAPATRQPA